MGARSDRITADDFLTPPELQAWRLATNPAGRIGGVRLSLTLHDGKTRFADCYQQVPLRVLPPFHFGDPAIALIYLLNPTAGLLDGDAQGVELRAAAGTRALVVGQSATRIHPAVHGYCTQQFRIHVEKDATLVFLPGPAIPFEGCRFYQHVDVTLDAGARFVWGDLWHAGRHARGAASERFRFDALIQDLSVRRQGQLVYRDRFAWRGPWNAELTAWHFGRHLACGNLFATGPLAPPAEAAAPPPACFPTAFGDTCIRWLGDPESVTNRLVAAALAVRAEGCDRFLGYARILTSGELAPNHWFLSCNDRES